MHSRNPLVAAIALAALLLTACTDASGTASPDRTVPPTAVPTDTALPEGAVQAPDIPSEVENDVGLRPNVMLTGCLEVDGGWEARGTAVNPGEQERSYAITVFFATPAATVLDHATANVVVPGGGAAEWSASTLFESGGEVRCVVRGVS